MVRYCGLSALVDWTRPGELTHRRVSHGLVIVASSRRRLPLLRTVSPQLAALPANQHARFASSSSGSMLSALRSVSPLVAAAAVLVAGTSFVASAAAAAARDDAFLILSRSVETSNVLENHNMTLLYSVFNVGGGYACSQFLDRGRCSRDEGGLGRDPSPGAQGVRPPWAAACLSTPARVPF